MTHWKKHWSINSDRPSNAADAGSTPNNLAGEQHRSEPRTPIARPARKHLTTNEAADYLRLSPRSLERYRVDGSGPSFLKAGPGKRARVFYRISDLDAWLEGKVFQSTSEYDSR